jgi:RNA-directed DNA polymerase
MKRTNHLLDKIVDIDNLRLAFWKARKGKSYTHEVDAYRLSLDANLLILVEQIRSGLIEVGDYRFFKVFEPKERDICASAFREQVLHHAMMNCCHDTFEKAQIFDSYASRKGKGTYAALEKAAVYTNRKKWFLKLDVRKFFASIHHEVLKRQLNCLFKEWRIQEIFEKIIDSYAAMPNRGLPIGNLTSQYFANHYLTSLDHFIKKELGIKCYIRYMDDMVLWHDDKAVLLKAQNSIENFLNTKLLCELKPVVLNRSDKGLPFLGYVLYPYLIQLNHNSKYRFIQKQQKIEANYQTGFWSESKCQQCILSLLAFTQHANTLNWRKKCLAIKI